MTAVIWVEFVLLEYMYTFFSSLLLLLFSFSRSASDGMAYLLFGSNTELIFEVIFDLKVVYVLPVLKSSRCNLV